MGKLVRVSDVEHLHSRVLRVTFTDGLVREVDFADALPGVLATIDEDELFAEATVDPVAGTLCWPNGIDLDPDLLHGGTESTSTIRPRLLREYRLRQFTKWSERLEWRFGAPTACSAADLRSWYDGAAGDQHPFSSRCR